MDYGSEDEDVIHQGDLENLDGKDHNDDSDDYYAYEDYNVDPHVFAHNTKSYSKDLYNKK